MERDRHQRHSIAWRAAAGLALAIIATAPEARADELRVSTASSAITRPLATGSSIAAAVLDDGGERDRAVSVVVPPGAGDVAERVIVELRGAPIARRAQVPGARSAQSAASAIAAEHRRVLDEIVRLEGGGPLARSAIGGPVRREFQTAFNGIAASLTPATRAALRAHPDVKAIHRDASVRAILDTSVAKVRAPAFWSQHGGYRGAGQVIAVIDTGIDYTHADLGACAAVGGACKVAGGHDFHNEDDDPADDNGHGSHVAAIAAGNGSLLGVAPDATLLAYKVLGADGFGLTSNVIAGIEAAIDPNGDLDTSDHADVINLSLGGAGGPDEAAALATDTATAAGALVVAAAGNDGGHYTIGSPGVARSALTVGAIADDGSPAWFTSGGPVQGTFDLKPEIAAPGVGICAARAAGTQLGDTCIDGTHVTLDGTSMATPHVAGAAALLRGVHPSLSPADVKSLLAQNGDPSTSDALQVGATILDVVRSDAAQTVVSPQALSFGLDDLTQSIWSTTRTLTVRNIGTTSRNYTLDAAGHFWGLPVGAAVTFNPASFSLAPGASTSVVVTLAVDNEIVPDQTQAPNVWDAMIQLRSSGQTQRIPLIFVKTPLLRVHTDQVATMIYVHDRVSLWNARAVVPTGTTADVLLPAGTYDVLVLFPVGQGAFVLHEGVVVDGLREETLHATEAVHTVSLTGRSELGATLATRSRAVSLFHHGSPLGMVTLSSEAVAPFAIKLSTISASYDLDLALLAQPGAKSYLVTAALAGVSASVALGNTPTELIRGAFRYHENPGETATQTMEFLSVMMGSSVGIGLGPPAVAPVDRDLWVTPEARPGANIFVQPTVFLSGGPDGAHNCPWYRGGAAPGVIQAFNPLDADDPVYETSTGELPLDLGPANLFAKFVNGDTWVGLRQLAAAWTWTFHAPGGDGPQAPGGTVGYRLLANGNQVASGVTPQSGFGGPALPFVYPLTPRAYVFETDPLRHWIGGLRAESRVAASFDLSRHPGDVDPPYLRRVEVRSAGLLDEVVPVGATATVLVEVHDDVDPAIVPSLARRAGGVEVEIPLVPLGGGVFTASMIDACDAAGPVDLVVAAADTAGNELREWLTPAFVCRATTCGNGTREAGEACDDGNLLSGDGCNAVCSSVEECGDGVLDAGEACDDGNTSGGDCCSASCQPEAAGTTCDDGRFCNGADACDGRGSCSRHGADPCAGVPECSSSCDELADACGLAPSGTACSSDGNACTDDACDGTGACVHAPNSGGCDDGVFCNGADTCAAGTCSTHAGDPCVGGGECADVCQEAYRSCFSTGACSDDGEPCTIDVCNGAGTCGHFPANPGFVCRPATEPCDVPEVCDGLTAACPSDSGIGDRDADAVCDGLDPCTNVAGSQSLLGPPIARLILGRSFAEAVPGNDTISLSGRFDLPPTTSFRQLFPIGASARVVLEDGLGVAHADVVLPNEFYSRFTRRGWSQSAHGKSWTYRDQTALPPGGIGRLVLRAADRSPDQPGGGVKLTLTGKKGSFAMTDGDQRANVVVTLGDQAAAYAGRCTESEFTAVDCVFNGQRTQLTCRR